MGIGDRGVPDCGYEDEVSGMKTPVSVLYIDDEGYTGSKTDWDMVAKLSDDGLQALIMSVGMLQSDLQAYKHSRGYRKNDT